MNKENIVSPLTRRREQLEKWKKTKNEKKRIKSSLPLSVNEVKKPKQVNVSSRLLQPTASSKARQNFKINHSLPNNKRQLNSNNKQPPSKFPGKEKNAEETDTKGARIVPAGFSQSTVSNADNAQSKSKRRQGFKYVEARIDSGLKRKSAQVTADAPAGKRALIVRSPTKERKPQASRNTARYSLAAPAPAPRKLIRKSVPLPCRTPRVTFVTPRKPRLTQPQMREKLELWLTSKGKTPSRFKSLLNLKRFGEASETPLPKPQIAENPANVETEKFELASKQEEKESPEKLLEECAVLFEAGCPADTITSWLDEIVIKHPSVKMNSRYWILNVKVKQNQSSYDEIMDIFKDAATFGAEPKADLSVFLKDWMSTHEGTKSSQKMLKKVMLWTPTSSTGLSTPRRCTDMNEDDVFPSSAIKYLLSQDTPFKFKSRTSTPATGNKQLAVVTPVRRSTRTSLVSLPPMLQDHDKVVNTLEEISPETHQRGLIFQPNTALVCPISPPPKMPIF